MLNKDIWMMIGANGYTLDPQNPHFSAAVVEGEQILAVGETDELRLQFGHRVHRVVDVEGHTVLPGFVDSHLHLAWLGLQMQSLDLSAASSCAEVLQMIAHHAYTLPRDAWVVGVNWDENRLSDKRMPSIEELDVVADGRPVFLRRVCGHVGLGNHRAYQLAGLGNHPTNPPGGYFGRKSSGEIDGYAYEQAGTYLESGMPEPTYQELRDALRGAMSAARAAGITAVHTEDVRHIGSLYQTMSLYQEIQASGLGLRIHQLVGHDFLPEYRDWLNDSGGQASAHRTRPLWHEAGAVKLFSDGSLGGHTAFLNAPYTDKPSTFGQAIYEQGELEMLVRQARDVSLPVAIHAIGDGALASVLKTLGNVGRVARRDRVIHAQVASPALIAQMAQLGDSMIVDAQPRFAPSDLPWIVERLGADRAKFVCAWKSMLDAGLYLCGGSDAPVEPIAPLLGIHAAMTRKLPGTGSYRPEVEALMQNERLTAEESVRLFTHSPSYAIHQEHVKGVIKPGYVADFTVIDTDIMQSANVDAIPTTKVVHTVVGGEWTSFN